MAGETGDSGNIPKAEPKKQEQPSLPSRLTLWVSLRTSSLSGLQVSPGMKFGWCQGGWWHLRKIDPSSGCQPVLLEPVIAEHQHAEAVAAVQRALCHLLNYVGTQVQLLGSELRVKSPSATPWWPSPAPWPLPPGPICGTQVPLSLLLLGPWLSVQRISVTPASHAMVSQGPPRHSPSKYRQAQGDRVAQSRHGPCSGTSSGSRTVLKAQLWALGRLGRAEERPSVLRPRGFIWSFDHNVDFPSLGAPSSLAGRLAGQVGWSAAGSGRASGRAGCVEAGRPGGRCSRHVACSLPPPASAAG